MGLEIVMSDVLLDAVFALHRNWNFPIRALEAIRHVVSANTYSYNEVDLKRWRIVGVVVPDVSLKNPFDVLARHLHEHPLVENHARLNRTQPCKLSSYTTQQRLHRLGVYNEFFRHIDVNYQAVVYVAERAHNLVVMTIDRKTIDFSDEEILLLSRLRPYLVQAYRNAMHASQLGASRQPDTLGMVMLNSKGGLEMMSERARQIMQKHFHGFPERATGLPQELHLWVRSQVAKYRENSECYHQAIACRSLPVCSNGRKVVAKLVKNHVDRGLMLVLEEEVSFGVNSWCFEGMGLSRQQSRVLEELMKGKTNKEIANALHLQPNTIKTYLQTIYEKLNVSTRAAAAVKGKEYLR